MRDIYRTAWAYSASHWHFLIVVAVMLEAFPLLLGNGNSGTGGSFVALVLVALSMHRFVLLGETAYAWGTSGGSNAKAPFGWFLLASIVMIGGVVAISLTLVLFIRACSTTRDS